MNDVELSIIIVSWNISGYLKNCLASLRKFVHINYEVIVVDNNSSDGTLSMVKEEFPEAKLVENKKNLGFAAANNQGISQSRGKWLLILNPDTVVFKETIEKSLIYMKKNPDIGVLGCRILNSDLSSQPSCRRFPDLSSQLLILLKVHHLKNSFTPIKRYLMASFDYHKTQEVDQVMGAFMLTKREIIEKVGLFDPNFFVWFEEVDFCRRVKKIGYKIVYFSEAKIIHHKGASFGQLMTLDAQKKFNRSLAYYFKKNHSSLSYFIILAFLPASYLLSVLVLIARFFRLIKPQNK